MPLVSSRMMTKSTSRSTSAFSGAGPAKPGWAGRALLRLGAASCAPKNSVGFVHRFRGVRRQHLAGCEVRNEAVLRFAKHHRNISFGGEPVEYAIRLGRYFRADPLAADYGHLDHVGQVVHADFLAKW